MAIPFRVLALLLAPLLLAGCVEVMRPDTDAAFRTMLPQEAVAIASTRDADREGVASAPVPTSPMVRQTVLALSGGGVDGAYSVGVLNGWTATGRRPVFDVVTGVSTGALVAVYAFLGPAYDAKLRELYLAADRMDIFRKRGLEGLLSDSLLDNTPLKRQIEREVTQGLLDRVAAEHARGRRLYIATTNLDGGQLVVWDMGYLASGGGDGRTDALQQFQKVLRASSAIPVFFPPVDIKPQRGLQLRQAHVDGAVKTPVLVSDFIFERPAANRRLYVIVNGHLEARDAFEPVRPNLRAIAGKSVAALTRSLVRDKVFAAYVKAANTDTRFRLTAIPEALPPPESSLGFDMDYLRTIYRAGYEGVQRPDFWWSEPPGLTRFGRVRGSRAGAKASTGTR